MTDRTKDELLPWVANKTATEDELREVEAYAGENPDARQELEFLGKLREGVKTASSDTSPGELGLARLRRSIAVERSASASSPSRLRWWQAAAVAATVVIAIQAAFLFGPTDRDGTLTTATGPGFDGATIQVTFVGEARETAIRELLLDLGLEIVEGPSAVGVYRLSAGPGADSRQTLSNIVSSLTQRSDLVAHAELEAAEP